MPEDLDDYESLFTPSEWRTLVAHFRLTPRETDVARYLIQDLPEVVIADRLRLSRHTIRSHVRSLKSKLRVRSRTEVLIELFRAFRAFSYQGLRQASSDD